MKAVIAALPPHWLAERKTAEIAQWDEMWDGVLHMPPIANGTHQDFAGDLRDFLKRRWAKPNGGLARCEVNLTTLEDEEDWTHNYRIPDLVLLSRDRLPIDKNTYMAGAPLVVIEIRSPGDESYEKLPFYAGLGVPEVWIFDRDTKAIELRALGADGNYAPIAPDSSGWHRSPATEVAFRQLQPGSIVARANDDPATDEELPNN